MYLKWKLPEFYPIKDKKILIWSTANLTHKPDEDILALSNLKTFANENFSLAQNIQFFIFPRKM